MVACEWGALCRGLPFFPCFGVEPRVVVLLGKSGFGVLLGFVAPKEPAGLGCRISRRPPKVASAAHCIPKTTDETLQQGLYKILKASKANDETIVQLPDSSFTNTI